MHAIDGLKMEQKSTENDRRRSLKRQGYSSSCLLTPATVSVKLFLKSTCLHKSGLHTCYMSSNLAPHITKTCTESDPRGPKIKKNASPQGLLEKLDQACALQISDLTNGVQLCTISLIPSYIAHLQSLLSQVYFFE